MPTTKLKNRLELARLFSDLGYKLGVEVGVCDGRYSEILLNTIRGLTLYGVDPFINYPGYGDYYYVIDEKHRQAHERLDRYKNYNFIREDSVKASHRFKNNSLDFAFIDGAHGYHHVRQDIEYWYPKIKKGHILAGHDYYPKCAKGGVVKAVDEMVKRLGVELLTTEWDMEAYQDDRQPDWFFYV